MKFHAGQRVLVMHSRSRPDLIGTEIVLGEWLLGEHFGEPSYEYFWDSAPLVYNHHSTAAIVWAESWLMPLEGVFVNESTHIETEIDA